MGETEGRPFRLFFFCCYEFLSGGETSDDENAKEKATYEQRLDTQPLTTREHSSASCCLRAGLHDGGDTANLDDS